MRNSIRISALFLFLLTFNGCAEKIDDLQPLTNETESTADQTSDASNRVFHSNTFYPAEFAYLHTIPLADGAFEQRLVLSADDISSGDDLEGSTEFVMEFVFTTPSAEPSGSYSTESSSGAKLLRVGVNHTFQVEHGLPEQIGTHNTASSWLNIAKHDDGYTMDFKVKWSNHDLCITTGDYSGELKPVASTAPIRKTAADFPGINEVIFNDATMPITGAFAKKYTKPDGRQFTTLRLPTESLEVDGGKLSGTSDMISLEIPGDLKQGTTLLQLGDWNYTFPTGYFARNLQRVQRTVTTWSHAMDTETGVAVESLRGNGGEAIAYLEGSELHVSLKFTMSGRNAVVATYSGPYTLLEE